jgi:hypothetical protein
MIFPPIELPQYIVVPPTDCEMKDIIGYHNKHLSGKISNYTAFFEKCGYLQLLLISTVDSLENRVIFGFYHHTFRQLSNYREGKLSQTLNKEQES